MSPQEKSIFDREVPEWLRPAVAVAVDDLPGEMIRAMTVGMPGGYTKLEAIREAWKRSMRGFREMPEELAGALVESVGAAAVVGRLSYARVMVALPVLLSLCGRERVAVALWLDLRLEVQALATPRLLEAETIPVETARAMWLDQVEDGFLLPVGCRYPQPSVAPVLAMAARSDAEHWETMERARKKLAEVRERHAAEAREWKTRHQAELGEIGERLRRAEEERDGARQALQDLESRYRADLQQALAEAENARWAHWFARAEAEASAVAGLQPGIEELIRQADQALERQAEVDRRQGQRTELRRQVALLRDRRDRLEAAALESLSPLPAVLRAQERLAVAIREREVLLKDTTTLQQTAGEVARAMAEADTEARLSRLRQLAQELLAAGVLDEDTVRRLTEFSVQRQQVLADAGLRERLAQGPVPTVGGILDGRMAGVMLVDAYNLMGEAVDVWGGLVVPGRMPATLKAVLPRLQQWATQRLQLEILVVVDSPHEHSRTLSGNVRVVYSGGQGEHRADQVIKGQLVHLKVSKETRAVVVVSHDAEVRQAAIQHGALVAHPRELAGRVMRMG